jgi:hypothetical protein
MEFYEAFAFDDLEINVAEVFRFDKKAAKLTRV